jgi:hypothetical protein
MKSEEYKAGRSTGFLLGAIYATIVWLIMTKLGGAW